MTDKTYIVANKEQELEVLKTFEEKGFPWNAVENAMSFVPSERFNFNESNFPYMLIITNENIWWSAMKTLEDETIVYDGRKEEKMYKVTQEFMQELIEWRDLRHLDARNGYYVATLKPKDLDWLPKVVSAWYWREKNSIENNNRLIAIIQWLNGEDVFEVENQHKFVVRSERADGDDNYKYVKIFNHVASPSYFDYATKFDTREEAQEWANSHQVVVEIDAEGNEIE
nr:hypothetical protein LBZUJACN_LBZUJACN_CDS_0042 [Caudoviricetes sp.]CAI9751064.1 hypothetical protein MIHLRAQX_MIHLRAQX_CDS_0042 [Caudoviricetes sp.]